MENEYSILIIDDSEDDRYSLIRLLKQQGINNIFSAESGEEGREIVANNRLDCVLLDYNMPGADGLNTLTELKLKQPQLPIIMLTGQGSEYVAVDSMKKGAADYIIKSGLTADVLSRSIKSAVYSSKLELKISEQRTELEQFARLLAHDLKQPANALNSMTKLILKNYHHELSSNLSNKLIMMQDTSEQMVSLISALVAYTKLELPPPEKESTDINHCLNIVLNTLEQKITQRRAKIDTVSLPVIKAIPTFITQILQILIDNALTYCPEGVHIKLNCEIHSEHIIVSIEDDGHGIEEKDLARIFDPMVRLSSDEMGSGLGLATAKRIVAKHNGDIKCHSEVTKGCKFVFTLEK